MARRYFDFLDLIEICFPLGLLNQHLCHGIVLLFSNGPANLIIDFSFFRINLVSWFKTVIRIGGHCDGLVLMVLILLQLFCQKYRDLLRKIYE